MTKYHPQEYDLTSKELFKGAESTLAELLLKKASPTAETKVRFVQYLDVSFEVIESQASDIIFEVRRGQEPLIFHVELQTGNHPEMLYRMYRYLGEIHRRYQMNVYQAVLYMGKEKLRMRSDLCILPGEFSHLDYAYHLIDLNQITVEEILGLNHHAFLPLLPLAQAKGKSQKHLQTSVELILTETASVDLKQRQNLLFKTEILAGLKYPDEVIQKVFGKVEKLLMLEQSVVYQRVLKEGVEQGLEQGLEQGMEQGRYQTLQAAILKTLSKRFGKLPAKVQARIKRTKDHQRLEALFEKALDVKQLDDF